MSEDARDTSLPTIPEPLPGEIWGVTAFFNPARYGNKLEHLRRCAGGVRAQGLKLLVVELAFGDTPFEVPDDVCDEVVRRRTTSVLWQKERLLNIGLANLPPACDKVVWLDGDIFFENDDWVRETSERLESYVVVQPYDTACWLPKGVSTPLPDSAFGRGNSEGKSLPSMGYAMWHAEDRRRALASYFDHGHTGFAWSIRREAIARHGFYDAQVLGNGDFVMGHAMYGNEDFWGGRNWECDRLSPELLAHITEWGRRFHEDVGSSVAYTPGRVFHLWHGNQSDRQYDTRLDVLKESAFDPHVDLKLDEAECWTWGSNKPELREWAHAYFWNRREE